METINERIYRLRKHLGLSQEAFGQRIGIKKASISMIEIQVNKRLNLFAESLMSIMLGLWKALVRCFLIYQTHCLNK